MSEPLALGPSRLARAVLIVGLVATLLLPVGALGSRFGFWNFTIGFQFLFGGILLAVVVLVGGIVALVLAIRRERSDDRRPIMLGLFLSLLVLTIMGLQFYTARAVPPIHNISTDTVDPPEFVDIVSVRGAGSNPLAYGDEVADAQQKAYRAVKTLRVEASGAESFDRALAVVDDMGWEVVGEDRGAMRIEATDTTFWFGFKDDVVIRIRPDGDGSKVDLRSVSRVGQSDLGANARRIMRFLERFEAYE